MRGGKEFNVRIREAGTPWAEALDVGQRVEGSPKNEASVAWVLWEKGGWLELGRSLRSLPIQTLLLSLPDMS